MPKSRLYKFGSRTKMLLGGAAGKNRGGVSGMGLGVIRPMEPVARKEPFDDPAWVYQVKWDGIRLISYIEGGHTVLRTRRGRECTAVYPELADIARQIRGTSAILDGEMVALDDRGRPHFPRILRRHLGGPGRNSALPIQYVVFDLVYLNGDWLCDRPLLERQALLETVVPRTDLVGLCDNHASGPELYRATARLGLEGIVAKEKNGRYHRDRKHRTWRKIKHFKEMDVVVAAVVMKEGRANALLTAAYVQDELTYVGRVATGLDAAHWRLFTELAAQAPGSASPPADGVRLPRNLDVRRLAIRPVVRVRFLEWTEQGLMREPVVIGPGTGAESEYCVD